LIFSIGRVKPSYTVFLFLGYSMKNQIPTKVYEKTLRDLISNRISWPGPPLPEPSPREASLFGATEENLPIVRAERVDMSRLDMGRVQTSIDRIQEQFREYLEQQGLLENISKLARSSGKTSMITDLITNRLSSIINNHAIINHYDDRVHVSFNVKELTYRSLKLNYIQWVLKSHDKTI